MMGGDVLMRIGEIAAFFGVSVKAMRVYEKMGILKPVKVDEKTGYRYYAADQVRQLDALLELRELGFSLAEIKELLEGGMSKDRYMEALVHKRMMWKERIARAQDRMDAVEEIIEKIKGAEPSVKLHELNEEERAVLLSRLACLDANLHDLHAKSVLSEALWL